MNDPTRQTPESEPVAPRLSQRELVDQIEQKMIARIDKLCAVAKRGCHLVTSGHEQFAARREEVNTQAGNDRAFLDDEELMQMATYYDMMNCHPDREPLLVMETERTLRKQMALLEQRLMDNA